VPTNTEAASTRTLTLSTIAVAVPMGQQVYEEQVGHRAAEVLGEGWRVRKTVVRTLRSSLDGTVRLPARVLESAPEPIRKVAGQFVYRGSDLVHRMDLRLPPASGPEILTIHDAVSWRFPDEARPPESSASEARRSLKVVCPSAFSAGEVTELLGIRDVEVIHNGVDSAFFSTCPMTDAELAGLGIRRPFVIHAGGSTLRKNLAGLADAWRVVHQARPDAVLALMGPRDPRRTTLFERVPGTVLLGRLGHDMARSVMAAASVAAVPSIYEGFGLPALEAMALGVPVVAADRSSLPEICGGAALLVEPTGQGIAEGIIATLDGGSNVTSLTNDGRAHAAKFTWEASAESHARLWRSAI